MILLKLKFYNWLVDFYKHFSHPSCLANVEAATKANENLVVLVYKDYAFELLTKGDYIPLAVDVQADIKNYIDLNKSKFSTKSVEVKNFPSIYIGVEDILAINNKYLTEILRIQLKTAWLIGLTGKTFITAKSTALVHKYSLITGESSLRVNGKSIDTFQFSYEDPKFKNFCETLPEKQLMIKRFIDDNNKTIVKNTIKLTIKDKLNN